MTVTLILVSQSYYICIFTSFLKEVVSVSYVDKNKSLYTLLLILFALSLILTWIVLRRLSSPWDIRLLACCSTL